jgi:hypothetical protein
MKMTARICCLAIVAQSFRNADEGRELPQRVDEEGPNR